MLSAITIYVLTLKNMLLTSRNLGSKIILNTYLILKLNSNIRHFQRDKKCQKHPTFNLNFRVSKIRIFQGFQLFLTLQYSNFDIEFSDLKISNF